MTRPRRIVALLPGLQGHGGIQRQNRALCGTISDWAVTHDVELDVVSLADPSLWIDRRYLRRPVVGCGGDRHRFGIAAGLALLAPYGLLIIGVADFGVLLAEHTLLRRRAPVLTVAHGIEVWSPLPVQHRWALTGADRILSVSSYTADVIVDLHGARRDRITVVPNPLGSEFVAGADAFRRSGCEPQPSDILSVARLNRIDAEKGIETLIRAVGRLAQPARLLCTIIGEGEDRPRLQALAADLGLAETVRFTGALPDHELHAYLAGARVFALPSRKEGFGIVFLEAMHYGVPVVAGAHGGALEVVAHEENGLLVQYGDVDGLAAALERLLTDEETAAAMGRTGRRIVAERFGEAAFAHAVHDLLDQLMDSANAERATSGDAEPDGGLPAARPARRLVGKRLGVQQR